MSSTLFNRGMTTQIGMRRRAEEVKKSIDELRSTVTDSRFMQTTIDDLTRENVVLRALVTAMEGRMSILETKVATANTNTNTSPSVDAALTSRVDTIESQLSTVATTTTQLQDRMGGVETNTSSVSSRVSNLESSTASVSDRINAVDSNLQGRITSVESSTVAVSDRINSLESRTSTLESRPSA